VEEDDEETGTDAHPQFIVDEDNSEEEEDKDEDDDEDIEGGLIEGGGEWADNSISDSQSRRSREDEFS